MLTIGVMRPWLNNIKTDKFGDIQMLSSLNDDRGFQSSQTNKDAEKQHLFK